MRMHGHAVWDGQDAKFLIDTGTFARDDIAVLGDLGSYFKISLHPLGYVCFFQPND